MSEPPSPSEPRRELLPPAERPCPPPPERPIPRGCHPLVFGVVMATIQMAALLYFMGSC